MTMTMEMINENENDNDNKVVQILRLLGQFLILFLFYERYFKHLRHKQKHLSNIKRDISKQKKHLINIQPDISKQKKHLSNIHSNKYVLKHIKNLL